MASAWWWWESISASLSGGTSIEGVGEVIILCEHCPHYHTKTIFRRKCYNDPQCLIGIALKMVGVVMSKVRGS